MKKAQSPPPNCYTSLMLKAVIFDMDGVLIDSISFAYQARQKLLAEHGIDIAQVPDQHGEQHRGSSIRTLLAAVKDHTGTDINEQAFADKAIIALRQYLSAHNLSADPYLVRLLDDLQRHHVRCAVATSGMRQGVFSKLSALGITEYFSVIVTANDVVDLKPAPDVYLKAAEQLGLDPKECVAVEDSTAGVSSAKAAGCKVIGFIKYNRGAVLEDADATMSDWNECTIERLNLLY